MTDIRETAAEIHDQFDDHLDIEVEDVQARLEALVNEYKVPMTEARRSVVSHYLEEAGIEQEDLPSPSEDQAVSISDIEAPEQWVDITAKVVQLWEPRSDAIDQVGLLGDETGTIKFTKWAKSELPRLEEEAVYRLQNVVTDEYQGRFSVKLNRTTQIERLETDLEVGTEDLTIEGALVDIQSGSGLIKRCPEDDCTRVLQNGRCSEHGEVEGEFDLRIKGVLDDGQSVQEVIFDQETTEELTDITLEAAKDMAMDALDTSVVAEEMRAKTLGRYYRVTGPRMGRYLLVNEVDALAGPESPESVLIRARSM